MLQSRKIQLFLLSFSLSIVIHSQSVLEKDSFSIRKISCVDDTMQYYGNQRNDWSKTYTDSVALFINYFTRTDILRVRANDNTKLSTCIFVKTSKNYHFSKCKECIILFEQTLNCKIIDTTVIEKVWVLRVGKDTQIKPLVGDKYVPDYLFALGVYEPYSEYDPVAWIIAKNGRLSQIVGTLENNTHHIVALEDESKNAEKYSFEISKQLLQRGNFAEIKAALKEAIGFELYEATRPIKVKYVKFL